MQYRAIVGHIIFIEIAKYRLLKKDNKANKVLIYIIAYAININNIYQKTKK